MENDKKPVETNPVIAGTQAGVETGTPKAPEVPEIDFLDEYNKLLEENRRLAGERDNYKRGMLKAKKGDDSQDSLTEEDVEKRAEERAQELIRQRQREDTQRRLEEIAQKALRENRELKVALKNRAQIPTAPSGAASDSGLPKVNETFFTPEQLAVLKKKGIDPQKVKENYLKLKS